MALQVLLQGQLPQLRALARNGWEFGLGLLRGQGDQNAEETLVAGDLPLVEPIKPFTQSRRWCTATVAASVLRAVQFLTSRLILLGYCAVVVTVAIARHRVAIALATKHIELGALVAYFTSTSTDIFLQA
ncbi:uncharacterized protein IUM83_17948 [Phytophthora cinnamomi]|uniref:uncharacterized protein n=1 Tax=Phytophthora cinnamomi TaxID=4785 RepID=UPI00355A42F1|nr:hypothetical protein IUM83_17948 [Phytophthora cinnamomi]